MIFVIWEITDRLNRLFSGKGDKCVFGDVKAHDFSLR